MFFKKSIYKNPSKSTKKVYSKQFTNKSNNNFKRKSDDMTFNHFFNQYKKTQRDKINKIPIKHRLSLQNKNLLISRFMLQNAYNEEKNEVKDKSYYLNYVNNIYLNDSHLTNKNFIKGSPANSSDIHTIYEKRKASNYSKRDFKDNYKNKISSKASKKHLSCGSNEIKKKSNKKISVSSAEVINELNNFKDISSNNKDKTFSEKIISKFQSSKALSKSKYHNHEIKSNKKLKSSLSGLKNKETNKENDNGIGNNEKKQKDMNLLKMQNNLKTKKRKISNLEIELEKSNLKDPNNIIINENKTNANTITNTNSNANAKRKNNKSCFFCCISQNDSFSDNE